MLINSETEPSVKLSRGKLNVFLQEDDVQLDTEARAALVKSLINKWYKNRVESISR